VFGYRGANFVSAQSPAPRANRSEPSHVLVPRELVQIKVFQEPDLDTAVRIPGDGHINSPLIGEVALAGQRVQQATRAIHDRLQARFLVNPQVSIGSGPTPGHISFSRATRSRRASGIAGGYTRLADSGRIILNRRIRVRTNHPA